MAEVTDSTQTQVVKTSDKVANGARKALYATTNPATVAILHFSSNVMHGDSFGQALDNAIDQTATGYKNLATSVYNEAKKVAHKTAESVKPKDKVELVMQFSGPSYPALLAIKRGVAAFTEYVENQWNSLPTISK